MRSFLRRRRWPILTTCVFAMVLSYGLWFRFGETVTVRVNHTCRTIESLDSDASQIRFEGAMVADPAEAPMPLWVRHR
jgi:hypothetical protein